MSIPCKLLLSLVSKQKAIYTHLCHYYFSSSNCIAVGQLSMALTTQHKGVGEFRAKNPLKFSFDFSMWLSKRAWESQT